VFHCSTLNDYHDAYFKMDVLLLADVFQNFREMCLINYGLDPAHFYTTPGMSFQACLKMSGVKLDLFTDPDMHLFVENNIRGVMLRLTTVIRKTEWTRRNLHLTYVIFSVS